MPLESSPTSSTGGNLPSAETALVLYESDPVLEMDDPTDLKSALPMPFSGPILADVVAPALTGAGGQKHFGAEAMRVLQSCEHMLLAGFGEEDRERVLKEISTLKKRYRSPPVEFSRGSISRHRRFSLGADARRILKEWVDDHIDDPYPSVAEKQQLAAEANLSIKQVNDWFTNYRKRHWEDAMQNANAGGELALI